ncbi:acyltransferase family protein [Methyloglobulus sp.]|uniref:acyltransferase family protein n=1 Tax=Methyloglobulus sp. TaxID=2518622 RepID=UPI0032B87A3C
MQNKARLVWIEILRVVSAFGILLYHTSLYFTHYAFSPSPNGLMSNGQTLVTVLVDKFGLSLNMLVGFVALFGFQFLDVFILLIGLATVLSWRGDEIYVDYLKRRWLRVLWPFWLAVFFTLVLSALHHYFFGGYLAGAWHWFVAFTYPLAYDFHGTLLQQISGPWWFVPFMLAVVVVSPFMLKKLEQWGVKNFLLFFGLLSLLYRLLSVYLFEAHINFSIMDTAVGEAPFLLFPAKIFLIALGMAFGKLIKERNFTSDRKVIFFVATFLYILGFVTQFSWLGWTVAEFFYAPAIVMLFYSLFSEIEDNFLTPVIIKLGALSYSFFLMHNFFAHRLSEYFEDGVPSFWKTLVVSTICSLIIAMLIEKLIPLVSKAFSTIWSAIDKKLIS